jgi:DNA-binding GntR family transcriptional regulator
MSRSRGGQVTVRIREKILSGAYPPGSPLLQDVIAAEFGVSKIPVREALVQLRAEGLVEVFANRGFQVRPLVAMEVDEVLRVRLLIEPQAAAAGAERAQAEDREAAQDAFMSLNKALDEGDLDGASALNHAFHLALVVPRLQPVTVEVLNRLHTLAQRYIRLQLQPEGRVALAKAEHGALYEAWAAGRTLEVSRLTAAHIERTRADLAQALPLAHRPEC